LEKMMRSTGNFSPEWGYLAPAPSIMRTVRVVLVATAVGATAGAGVVLSLVDRSAADGEQVSAAAHAIVTGAQAAPAPANVAAAAPPVANAAPVVAAAPVPSEPKASANVTTAAAATVAQAPTPNAVQAAPQIQAPAPVTQPVATAPPQQVSNSPAVPPSDASAPSALPPAMAALSDASAAAPATSANDAVVGDQTVTAPQPAPKKTKHHTSNAFGFNGPNLGPALRHLFSARAGTSYYPNRGL
jgi:outer membrane biosynthesis protein TonB